MKWKPTWKQKERPNRRVGTSTRTDEKSKLIRVNVVYTFVFLSFTSLILRLGYVQIVRGSFFRGQLQQTSLYKVPVLPARGWIYDAYGNLLAYDKPSYSVFLTQLPHVHQSFPDIAKILAPQFSTSSSSILDTIMTNKAYATIRLFQNISKQQLAFVEENKSTLPGVNVVMDSQRVYPEGDLAGKVLGYVGKITPLTVAAYKKLHYLPTQTVGETGLEYQYESLLQGKIGYQVAEVTSQGTPLQQLGFDPPETSGDNLQLTLDGHLQAFSQNAVIQDIQSSTHTHISGASVVVLDVKTGGVLAMVSYPYYDPNWYTTGAFLKHVNYLQTSGAQLNTVIQSPGYPGSTVKPANIYTGLTQGVITPTTSFADHYWTWVGKSQIHDDASHGIVDTVKALEVSCDTFLYEVGLWLGKWDGSGATSSQGGGPAGNINYMLWLHTDFVRGINALFQGEYNFGLGRLTGIDLPGEQAGTFYVENYSKGYLRVPYHLQQAEAAIKKTGSYTNYATPIDLAFSAIGQSQQFTPIELAQYVATIADGGKRIQPHLLEKIYAPGTSRISMGKTTPEKVIQTTVQQNLHLNPTYLSVVQQGMYDVANNPSGTASGSFMNAPYKAAGKTGTAQIRVNGRKEDNAVYIGYAPFNNPQIAIAIMIPGGGYGAETAVPLARVIMDEYFKEHHEFFPASQWQPTSIPSDWTKSPAYVGPEQSK